MKILYLCPYEANNLSDCVALFDDEVLQCASHIEPVFLVDQGIEFIVSYG